MNGKNFSVGHISKILNNKVYIGKITYKNEEYEGLHLGIIDVELFKQVQMCLQKIRERENMQQIIINMLY